MRCSWPPNRALAPRPPRGGAGGKAGIENAAQFVDADLPRPGLFQPAAGGREIFERILVIGGGIAALEVARLLRLGERDLPVLAEFDDAHQLALAAVALDGEQVVLMQAEDLARRGMRTWQVAILRSEEHTSELQSLMRISS